MFEEKGDGFAKIGEAFLMGAPCPFDPGTLAQEAMYQGPSCSTTAVNSFRVVVV